MKSLEVNKVSEDNLSERIRMSLLYYHANLLNELVVGTADKSEIAAGPLHQVRRWWSGHPPDRRPLQDGGQKARRGPGHQPADSREEEELEDLGDAQEGGRRARLRHDGPDTRAEIRSWPGRRGHIGRGQDRPSQSRRTSSPGMIRRFTRGRPRDLQDAAEIVN